MMGDLCEGKTIPDTHWNMLDVRDLALAQRLAAESEVDHASTVGGPRYQVLQPPHRAVLRFIICRLNAKGACCWQMVTAEGQFYISSGVPGPRENVPGLAERIGALFPQMDVGQGGESPNDHFISNAADCTKLKEVLGLPVTPADVTIQDTVESLLELELITPRLKPGAKL